MRSMRLAAAVFVAAASTMSFAAPLAAADEGHDHDLPRAYVTPHFAHPGQLVTVVVRCGRGDERRIIAHSEAFDHHHAVLWRDGGDRWERKYIGQARVEDHFRGGRGWEGGRG